MRCVSFSLLSVLLPFFALADDPDILNIPSHAVPVFTDGLGIAKHSYANFHLILEQVGDATLTLGLDQAIALPAGRNEIAYEHLPEAGPQATLRHWHNGTLAGPATPIEGFPQPSTSTEGVLFQAPVPNARWDRDFTLVARFKTKHNGTLASHAGPETWQPNAKALFLRGGRLVYDIGWLGQMQSRKRFNDGRWHTAIVTMKEGHVKLFADGKKLAAKKEFIREDQPEHLFQIGRAGNDFGGDYKGDIEFVRFFQKASTDEQAEAISKQGDTGDVGKAVVDWPTATAPNPNAPPLPPPAKTFGKIPGLHSAITLKAGKGFKLQRATIQPLDTADHHDFIEKLNDPEYASAAFERGAKIYGALCVTCHGTLDAPGSLPTAPRFHQAPFKRGADPYNMYRTLTDGLGLMVPQPQYSASEKYDVIHYIREHFVKKNAAQYKPSDLTALPRAFTTYKEEAATSMARGKPYERMNFGPALMWTYEVEKGNIADKAIAIRLDAGPGGVSKGRAWMVYDHDTMNVATAYTGSFVDWRGIAFDGSHGTHTAITGEPLFINPDAPGWANPKDSSWQDERFIGRDDKPYGPLPRDWTHYKGMYTHTDTAGRHRVVLKYTVGDATILEHPALLEYGATPIFTRTLKVRPNNQKLVVRLAPESAVKAFVDGPATIQQTHGFHVGIIPPADSERTIAFYLSDADEASVNALVGAGERDFDTWTSGGEARWPERLQTEGKLAAIVKDEDSAYVGDEITIPHDNPWDSWMRLGGFDFFPGGSRAAVCTWNGDVWLVDGVDGDLERLIWKRIANGLFQPLGVKVMPDGKIYVTCRDQIARLHDLNGDEEIDYIESFNNDHQVTEHFHEFAMGLQSDDEGNLYYAKSACHARPARVTHHGTLLKVSADGSETEILATGFRAANGVCLNPDGSFFVTDQEGHWTPKNRINRVTKGGFYGNMMGYTLVNDKADAAMDQPMVWITNAKDRSPAELLWVTSDQWGPTQGSLLNLSYGFGQAYIVPHEKVDGRWQGGVTELPLPRFPTGLMRGRFHPGNGQLYTCGMFAWAGSQHAPGGFYRVRYTGKPLLVATGLEAHTKGIDITFSAPLLEPSARNFKVKIWDLKRGPNYGSRHYNEQSLHVKNVRLSPNGKTVSLNLPNMTNTWCMEIRYELKTAKGRVVDGVIHNTIHRLSSK